MPDDMTLAHHVRTQLCLTVECKFDKGCGCLDAIASALKAAEVRVLRRAAEVAKGGAKQCADGESEWHRGFRYAARATALEIAHEINSLAEDRG